VSVLLNKTKSMGYNQRFVTALPNIHFEVLHVLSEGDHVPIHWIATGTHDERLATVTGGTIPHPAQGEGVGRDAYQAGG
jgi:SnoaL-like polyketide cyclase